MGSPAPANCCLFPGSRVRQQHWNGQMSNSGLGLTHCITTPGVSFLIFFFVIEADKEGAGGTTAARALADLTCSKIKLRLRLLLSRDSPSPLFIIQR